MGWLVGPVVKPGWLKEVAEFYLNALFRDSGFFPLMKIRLFMKASSTHEIFEHFMDY